MFSKTALAMAFEDEVILGGQSTEVTGQYRQISVATARHDCRVCNTHMMTDIILPLVLVLVTITQ